MQFAVLSDKPGYRIRPVVCVRFDEIENIFHRTSGFEPEYRSTTPTLGIDLASTFGEEIYEVALRADADLTPTAARLLDVFRERAVPYFAEFSELADVDRVINDRPSEHCIHGGLPYRRCSTGVIVAKLRGRRNYDELTSIYRSTLEINKFYLAGFDRLLLDLDTYFASPGPHAKVKNDPPAIVQGEPSMSPVTPSSAVLGHGVREVASLAAEAVRSAPGASKHGLCQVSPEKLTAMIQQLSACGIGLRVDGSIDRLAGVVDPVSFKSNPFRAILISMGDEQLGGSFGYFSDNIWHFDTECIEGQGDYVRIVERMRNLAGGACRLNLFPIGSTGKKRLLRSILLSMELRTIWTSNSTTTGSTHLCSASSHNFWPGAPPKSDILTSIWAARIA